MENTYTLAVYIPGVTYKSKGPGFVDAIKLTATDHNNPKQEYKIYTEYGNASFSNIVYRTTKRQTTYSTTDTSAFKVQNVPDVERSAYGKFYDYLDEMAEDGTIGHTLTCFSNVSTAKQMQSHNQQTKDGLFIIVVNEADALIDLKFEFYTLSANKYNTDSTDLENDYILIGEKTSLIRPSTYGDEASIDMIAEEALTLYYDITRKGEQTQPTVHLPISKSGDALKVLQEQEDGTTVNILENGNDAFAEYTEKLAGKTEVFKNDAPIIRDVATSENNSFISTEAQATLAMYVGKNILHKDGLDSHVEDWFTCPTFVNVGPRQTTAPEQTISFNITNVLLENTNILWGKQPTFVVKNYTYDQLYRSNPGIHSTISVLEYMPSLTNILFVHNAFNTWGWINNNSGSSETLTGWDPMETGKTRDYGANINNAGKIFACILSELPYTVYSIKSYISNFNFKRNTNGDGPAHCVFIDRPHYTSDLVSKENGILKHDYIDNLKNEYIHSCNLTLMNEFTIMSDISKNKIHDFNTWMDKEDTGWTPLNIYPLVKMYEDYKGNLASEIGWQYKIFGADCVKDDEPLYQQIKLIQTNVDPSKERLHTDSFGRTHSFIIDRTVYQHVFTLEDTKSLPCILGELPISIVGKPTIEISDIQTSCKSPVLQFLSTWGSGNIYAEIDGGYDAGIANIKHINEDLSYKCPAHKAFIDNHYQDIVNWARGQNLLGGKQTKIGEKFAGKYPFQTGNRYYEQKIVISPMIGIDYNKSKMTFSNTGDYEIIPAYYYGDAVTENGVSTDIKGLKTNVELVSKDCITELYITKPAANKITPITSSFSNRTIAPVAVDDNGDDQADQLGTLKDILTLYNDTELTNIQTGYIHFYNVELEPGLYVFKFQPYVDAFSGIEFLNLNNSNALSCELYYTYNENENHPKLTLYGNFIVIYVKNPYNGDLGFLLKSKQEKETIRVSNFGLFKVQMEDSTNVNQALIRWWYDTASQLDDFKNADKPILISDAYPKDSNAYKFVHTLYDNIIFPSAICAYDNFTLFAATDSKNVPGYTKHYKSLYFPENPIYNIVGKYNISDMTITHIDFDKRYVDDAFTMEDAICYNQISRQYHG